MPSRFPWKAVLLGGGALGAGLLALKTYNEKHQLAAPKRVALIGDSYAVGLGPELAKLLPDFKSEGHVGNSTSQWANHNAACGTCGDWLTAFKPDVVIVSLGVNDGELPNPTNYQTIVRALHGLGARVVWIEPPAEVQTPSRSVIASLGVPVIPGTASPLAADGLHPKSYGPWAQEIAKKVA